MFNFEGSGWQDYIFIIIIFAFLIWSIFRRKKAGNTKVDAVVGVLTNINENQRIMEERLNNWQSKKKFQTANWKTYQSKLDFLDSSLMTSLNETFSLAEDYNNRIDSARRSKMMSTLQDMPLEKMRGPLTKSKEGITVWLKTNYQTETQSNQRRGCSGF